MTIAPIRTRPLYDLSDLVESLSTSSALAESWAARRSAVTVEGNSAMLQPVRA